MIKGNTIASNLRRGVHLQNHAAPHVVGNAVQQNHFSGIRVDGDASGQILHNTFDSNRGSGVWLDDGAVPNLMNNQVSNNGRVGIGMCAHSRPSLQDNTIEDNAQDGIEIEDNANPVLVRNTILEGGIRVCGISDTSALPWTAQQKDYSLYVVCFNDTGAEQSMAFQVVHGDRSTRSSSEASGPHGRQQEAFHFRCSTMNGPQLAIVGCKMGPHSTIHVVLRDDPATRQHIKSHKLLLMGYSTEVGAELANLWQLMPTILPEVPSVVPPLPHARKRKQPEAALEATEASSAASEASHPRRRARSHATRKEFEQAGCLAPLEQLAQPGLVSLPEGPCSAFPQAPRQENDGPVASEKRSVSNVGQLGASAPEAGQPPADGVGAGDGAVALESHVESGFLIPVLWC